MAIPRFHLAHAAVLVVDLQEKLLHLMHNHEALTRQAGILIDGAAALDVPILVTEQYPKGLGPTVPAIAAKLGGAVCNHSKTLFSACTAEIAEALQQRGKRQVLVCGIEAHVCILQTCLDLAEKGLVVGLVCDAIGSRRKLDHETAVQRMIQAGIIPVTAESVLLELVREAGTPAFKAVLPIIR